MERNWVAPMPTIAIRSDITPPNLIRYLLDAIRNIPEFKIRRKAFSIKHHVCFDYNFEVFDFYDWNLLVIIHCRSFGELIVMKNKTMSIRLNQEIYEYC